MFKCLSISACGVALLAGSLLLASPTMARFVPRDAAPQATPETEARADTAQRARPARARSARHARSSRRLHRRHHSRTRVRAHSRSAARGAVYQPKVILGIYPGADGRPQPQAQERKPRRRGFSEVPRSPRSLLVTSATAPLPFTPGCSEVNSTDHLGYGWFMLVATRTCFVR